MKLKNYIVTEQGVETTVQASSKQNAMNSYFGVERAVQKMGGGWGDKRGGHRMANIIISGPAISTTA